MKKIETKKADCKPLATPVQNRALLRTDIRPLPARPDPTKRRPGSLSRSILALVAVLVFQVSSFKCEATITVTGMVYQITGQALDTKISFIPREDVLLNASGLSGGAAKTTSSTNGAFGLPLDPGDYLVRLPLVPGRNAFTIAVGVGTGEVNITNLIALPWTYEMFINTITNFATTNLVTVDANGRLNVETQAVQAVSLRDGSITNHEARVTYFKGDQLWLWPSAIYPQLVFAQTNTTPHTNGIYSRDGRIQIAIGGDPGAEHFNVYADRVEAPAFVGSGARMTGTLTNNTTGNAAGATNLYGAGLDAMVLLYEPQIDQAAAVGYYAAGRARREAGTLVLTNSAALVESAGQRATNLMIGPNLNGSGTGRTIVNHQPAQRFRMSGYLKAVSLWVPPDSAASYNIVFRTFSLGSSTNNFTTKYSSSAYAVATGSNYVTITDSIPVQEGDYIGVFLPSTGGNSGVSAITNSPGDSCVYAAGNVTSADAYFSGKVTGSSLNLKAWTSAPMIAFCGDSITAGHHGLGVSWYPFMDTDYPAISGFIYNSFPYQVWTNYALDTSYCNYGAGGKNTAWIAANGVTAATNDNASVLVFAGGANDIAQELPWSSMLSGLNTARQKWPQSRPFFVAEILPFQGSHASETDAQQIRTFNANIREWAATNNAVVLPFWKYFGGSDLDYLLSTYDSGDGVHLSTAGAVRYAQLLKPYLSSVVNTYATTNNWP